jgi:AraC family transcriptional regulator
MHHFLRLFTKYVGLSPYQYILKRKIDISKALLIETDNQIIDIAFEIGFNSHTNFSTRFKKFTGITPEEYRKTNRIQKWF